MVHKLNRNIECVQQLSAHLIQFRSVQPATFSDLRSLLVTIAIYFTSHSPLPKKRFHCFAFFFFLFFNLILLLCEASVSELCSINDLRPTHLLAFESRSLVFRCVVNSSVGI